MKKLFLILIALLFVAGASGQRTMEKLGRGVVAVRTATNSAFVSWRLLGTESQKTGFNLYKLPAGGNAVKLNTGVLTAGTNFTDNAVNFAVDNDYFVKPVVNGTEQPASASFTLKANVLTEPCLVVPLKAGKTIHFVWVGDLDGDGEYDFVVDRLDFTSGGVTVEAYKRDGTFLWSMNMGPNSVNMDNISPGSSCLDVGMWDGLTVYDMDGDGKAEVLVRSANGVVFGDGQTLTNSNDNVQFISVLNGLTGSEKARVQIPTDFLSIGPMACQMGIGYLNGKTPSLLTFMRNRDTNGAFHDFTCAYDYDGTAIRLKWKTLGSGGAYGHQMRILDFNGDGIDDFGALGGVLNGKDGSLLYSLGGDGVGHGDRWHVGKLDPNRQGLQGYGIQQDNTEGIIDYYYDATTGKMIWKHTTLNVGDTGRGTTGDLDPRYPGYEVWSFSGLFNGPTNKQVNTGYPYPNFRLWWDGDLLSECYNDGKLEKFDYTTSGVNRLLTAWNYETATGSDRAAPMFYGDILGDWREEVVMTSSDYSKLIIFTSPIPTTSRLYTLAHNPEYRNSMTVKGYMQSHMVDYYLGAGMTTPPTPPIQTAKCVWKGNLTNNVWDNSTTNWITNGVSGAFTPGDDVMFDISGAADTTIILNGIVSPSSIKVISPLNYSFNGQGSISGNTGLLKSGFGALSFNTRLNYSDTTRVEEGSLYVNDTLSASPILVYLGARLGGNGLINENVSLVDGSFLAPGVKGQPGTLTFKKDLKIPSALTAVFDITNDSTGKLKPSDKMIVQGNLSMADTMTISVNKVNGTVLPGSYPLIVYSGTFSGNIKKIAVTGLFGQKYAIANSNGVISLNIEAARNAANVVWNGSAKLWDLQTTPGWNLADNPVTFVANDSIVLDSLGSNSQTINVVGTLPVSRLLVSTTTNNYTMSGTGNIGGSGSLIKNGAGTFSLLNTNSFTGKTIVNGGTLEVSSLADAGVNSSIGANPSVAATELQLTNSTLKYSGTSVMSTNKGITLNGSNDTINIKWLNGSLTIQGLIAGPAGLVKTGAGILNLQKTSNTFSGSTVIKAGTLSLGDEAANLKGVNSGSITFDSGTLTMYSNTGTYTEFTNNMIVPLKSTGTLNTDARCNYRGTLTGGGTFNVNLVGTTDRTIFFGNWSAFTGTINLTGVSGCRFRIANTYGYENATINVGDNISMYHGGAGTNGGDGIASSVKIGALTGTALSSIFEENWTIGAKNIDCRFNGVISGNSITKIGTGTFTLSGINTYSGGTTVSNGTLMIVNTSGSGTGTGAVNVNNGGSLAGTGFVAGATRINSGGSIVPGNNAVGTLSFNTTLSLTTGSKTSIKIAGTTNSKLAVTGALVLGGTLELNNSGTYQTGASYTLFTAASVSGQFDAISPINPGDSLRWNISRLSEGVISVERATGIEEILTSKFQVYPNPTSNNLYFNRNSSEEIHLEIFNETGIMLKNILLTGNKIDVSDLPSGIYFVRVEGYKNARFIKK